MKKTFLTLFMYCFIDSFGQSVTEDQVGITMTLNSVIEVHQLSKNYVKVANTENIILNYCDKYIKVPAGIHLILVDVNQYCHLVTTSDDNSINFESEAEESKIIYGGMKTIDYFSSQIIRTEDYIEYTICDTVIDKY
jgi:hypothetical protein